MDPDEFLPRAIIRPQPQRAPRIELDDVIGAVVIVALFVILFAVPWGF